MILKEYVKKAMVRALGPLGCPADAQWREVDKRAFRALVSVAVELVEKERDEVRNALKYGEEIIFGLEKACDEARKALAEFKRKRGHVADCNCNTDDENAAGMIDERDPRCAPQEKA